MQKCNAAWTVTMGDPMVLLRGRDSKYYDVAGINESLLLDPDVERSSLD